MVMFPQTSSCVVTMLACADRTVWMRVIGALDMDAEPALTAAVTRLSELTPDAVILEFAGVTFAGATLSHFLIRLHTAVPDAPVRMRHASPCTRLVMMATGTAHLVVDGGEDTSGNAN